ncbi:MAG: hypothetical protein WBO46_16220, partial [Caldilineaceae bacterium]
MNPARLHFPLSILLLWAVTCALSAVFCAAAVLNAAAASRPDAPTGQDTAYPTEHLPPAAFELTAPPT